MNKMNTLRAIDVDLNYLAHYNTKGSHWYRQGDGKRYQAHAKYAMGKPNPDTERKSSSDRTTKSDVASGSRSKPMYYSAPDKTLGQRVSEKLTDAKAKRQAKADAAVAAALKDSGSKGAQRLESRNMLGRVVGGALGAAAGYAGAKAGQKSDYSAKEPTASAVNKYGVSGYGGKVPKNVAINKYGASNYVDPRRINVTNNLVNNKSGTLLKGYNAAQNAAGAVGKVAAGAALGAAAAIKNPGVSAALTGFTGARVGSMAHYATAYNGYLKRGQGTLKGSKVSKQYRDTYKKTYDTYLKKYSQKASSGLTYGSTKALKKYAS